MTVMMTVMMTMMTMTMTMTMLSYLQQIVGASRQASLDAI